MASFDSITLASGSTAYQKNSFALENYRSATVLDSVEVSKTDAAESVSNETQYSSENIISIAESQNQDSFEMRDYDVDRLINSLFRSYGKKLCNTTYSYHASQVNNEGSGAAFSLYESRAFFDMYTVVRQDGFSEKDIVTIAAEVGKTIDERYKSGSITDNEYDMLNAEIENCTKIWVDQLYTTRAGIREEENWARIRNGCTPEEIQEIMQGRRDYHILEIARIKKEMLEQNPPDYDAMFAQIKKLRVSGINTDKTEQNAESLI